MKRLLLSNVIIRSVRKLLNSQQYGFIHRQYSVKALCYLREKREYKKKMYLVCYSTFHRFSSSLWLSWPPILLHVLRLHKCPKNLYKLLHSVFTHHQVQFNSPNESFTIRVMLGCPQGSPLGSVLWSTLVSGLLVTLFPELVHTQAYSDYVFIVLVGSSQRKLEEIGNQSLQIVCKWSHNHSLKLNSTKCFC